MILILKKLNKAKKDHEIFKQLEMFFFNPYHGSKKEVTIYNSKLF